MVGKEQILKMVVIIVVMMEMGRTMFFIMMLILILFWEICPNGSSQRESMMFGLLTLKTTPLYTPSLEKNIECLRDQIEYVAAWNSNPITIVSHSMGGLVSRGAIRATDSSVEVDKLFTMGSPHAGIPFELLAPIFPKLVGLYCLAQPAVCEMTPSYMALSYNKKNPNLGNVDYYFIGGDGGAIIPGPDDGLVGQYSAVGWGDEQAFYPSDWASLSSPWQYFTNESHPGIGDPNKSYYVAQSGQERSNSFECISAVLDGRSINEQYCTYAWPETAQASIFDLEATSSAPISLTEIKTGHLDSAQEIVHSLDINNVGEVRFYLNWDGEVSAPNFILTRPDGQVIDTAYAVTHPEEVTFETGEGSSVSAPYATYHFVNAQSGAWQASITASDAIDYKVFGMLDSSLLLTLETDKTDYQIGDSATITATLERDGLDVTGAAIDATLTLPDGTQEIVILTETGNGVYTNTYLIPNAPGYLIIESLASGSEAGSAFTRSKSTIVSIISDNLQLTGTYLDQGQDGNTDGVYESLDFGVEVTLVEAGDYSVSAELYAGEQLITHFGNFFSLVEGTQTITLPFDGQTIRETGLDGPYTIRKLYVTPIELGITAQSVETVWTTAEYNHEEFGVCYPLMLVRYGDGSIPTALPESSTNCYVGSYVEGEEIQLGATPANGWSLRGWDGTNNDNSLANINTLTMPDGNHFLSIEYQDITSPTVLSSILADANPTNASSVDFTVTFSESVASVDVSNFTITTTGVSGASITSVSGSGDTRTITVNTGFGNGTIRLDVNDSGTGIQDTVGNPLDGGFTSGEIYTVAKLDPAEEEIEVVVHGGSSTTLPHVTITNNSGESCEFTVSYDPVPPGGGLPDTGEMPLQWHLTSDCASLNVDLVFSYSDIALAYAESVNESNLEIFRNTVGETWTNLGGVVDVDANTIIITGITSFSHWTVGDSSGGSGPTSIALSSFTVHTGAGTAFLVIFSLVLAIATTIIIKRKSN